jgi:sialate O-acetylesterase
MNRRIQNWLCFVIAVTLICTTTWADIRLPAVIGDNMVLQRCDEAPIWGWAAPGEEISIVGSWAANTNWGTVAAQDGKWLVRINPPKQAGGPHTLTIKGKNTITVKNILVGEVWVASGQSNMQWSLNAVNNAQEEIAAANYPEIRLFYVPRVPAIKPMQDVKASWKVCTPADAQGFSAVAYFFGREIYQQVGVPVGLINTSWGGTRIEPWTPPAGFEATPKLEYVLKILKEATPKHRQAMGKTIEKIEKNWLPKAKAALEAGKDVPPLPNWPKHLLTNHQQPTALYNGMVHALVPFAIRGAIWYQGESNRGEGMMYYEKMKALIKGWRTVWDQGDFPYYFVQLAPYRYVRNRQDAKSPQMLPEIWEAQTATLKLPNTGMAVTVDIGNINDIHPRNKQDVGKRLALWALAKVYGKDKIVYSGPLYKSMKAEGNKIRLSFDHVGSGLTSRDSKDLNWFMIAGEDKEFVEAKAVIDGDTVVVSSDKVKNPVAVRFGWDELAEPNLSNKEGLPASPFRTDK